MTNSPKEEVLSFFANESVPSYARSGYVAPGAGSPLKTSFLSAHRFRASFRQYTSGSILTEANLVQVPKGGRTFCGEAARRSQAFRRPRT